MPRLLGPPLAAVLGVLLVSPQAHASPLEPKPLGQESYGERFVVTALTADGTYVHFRLQLDNAGVGDAKSECRAVVAPPKIETWQRTSRSGPGHWSYAPDPFPLLRVGPCYLRGGDALEVHAELDGVSVTLTLQATPQTLRLRGNRVKMAAVNGDFYEKTLLVPWAPARLSIRFPNGKQRVRHGFGYSDHSRWTVLPYDIAKRWLRVRSFDDERSLLIETRIPPDDADPTGWVWREAAEGPAAVTGVELLAFDTPEGKRWKAKVSSGDGTYRITLGPELDRYAPVEEMGILGYVLESLVGNPTTHTFRGTITRLEDEQEWTGIVEVHNENE